MNNKRSSLVESRKFVEKYIGRPLLNNNIIAIKYPSLAFYEDINELVHHINGDQDDIRIDNLYIFRNNFRHRKYHTNLKNWAILLCSKTMEEKIKLLKSFPELESNLHKVKVASRDEHSFREYVELGVY